MLFLTLNLLRKTEIITYNIQQLVIIARSIAIALAEADDVAIDLGAKVKICGDFK